LNEQPFPEIHYETELFVLAPALTLIIDISSEQIVKADLHAPTTGAGAAVIKGVVEFAGIVPASKPISMSADPSCSKQHSRPVLAQEVVVDSTGGMQYAIVFISTGLRD
jgi:hypothetical protein